MKVLLITWSYDDNYPVLDSLIYKSLNKLNLTDRIVHIHYNRNNYNDLESIFRDRFQTQYEYILYKIFLLRDKISKINFDKFIYCDTNDVVCVKSFDELETIDETIFSNEIHRYPNNTNNWFPINDYSLNDLSSYNFLNSGVFVSNKKDYLLLLEELINNVIILDYKNFGGDQGVFTYHYINNLNPKIKLDNDCRFFLSTYLRDKNDFELTDKKTIKHKYKLTEPFFIHDNGLNYGSPKFIEFFNLI